jgi:hypothetical protein
MQMRVRLRARRWSGGQDPACGLTAAGVRRLAAGAPSRTCPSRSLSIPGKKPCCPMSCCVHRGLSRCAITAAVPRAHAWPVTFRVHRQSRAGGCERPHARGGDAEVAEVDGDMVGAGCPQLVGLMSERGGVSVRAWPQYGTRQDGAVCR